MIEEVKGYCYWFDKGCENHKKNKLDKAIECYNTAIRLKPDYSDSFYNKGLALNALEGNIEAIACYDSAIRLKPDYAEAYYNKGIAFDDLGRNIEAIECYDLSIKIKPDYSEAYLNKGLALSSLGKKIEAIECYDSAIRLNPDNASVYLNKGLALFSLGKSIDAIECYNLAIKLKPDYASAYLNKGLALFGLGRKLEAIECFDSAIRLKPDYASAYLNKGNALKNIGNKNEAIECYDAAIRFRPNYAKAYNNKGITLLDLGRKNEAIECYDAAIRLKPNSTLYYCGRAKVLIYFEREMEALQDLNTANALIQEAQNNSSGNAFSEENCKFINKMLSQNRVQLLNKLTNLQKNAIEFKEGLQKLKSVAWDNAKLQKELDSEYSSLQTDRLQIVTKVVDIIDSTEQDEESHQKVLNADKEISILEKRMQEELYQLNMKIEMILEQKVNRNEIESHALKINSEIENNPNLKPYYEAIYDRLRSALSEAEVICGGGNIAINTSNLGLFALSKAIELTPIIGSLISSTFYGAAKRINRNKIRKYAIRFKSVMGSNPSERENVIKKAAETVTLHNRAKIDNIDTNIEVKYWISKGFLTKCRDFFIVDVDYILYQSKQQILGCIDALKIIYAIANDQIKHNSNSDLTVIQIALVPSAYKFSQDRTVSSYSKKKACHCKIFLINKIEYSNPLLNKPELLKKLSNITGFPIYKVIDYSNVLINLDYDVEKSDFEPLCFLMANLSF